MNAYRKQIYSELRIAKGLDREVEHHFSLVAQYESQISQLSEMLSEYEEWP